jgi:chaperonin cofactor prefoldin
MNINQQIEMLESKIDSIKSNIENKQSEIDSFEYEISESDFDEFLDEIEQPVNVCGMGFYPSDILKSCDPIAYRCYKSDYASNIDLDDVAEYVDLKDELEVLESELEDLESELEDLQSELED